LKAATQESADSPFNQLLAPAIVWLGISSTEILRRGVELWEPFIDLLDVLDERFLSCVDSDDHLGVLVKDLPLLLQRLAELLEGLVQTLVVVVETLLLSGQLLRLRGDHVGLGGFRGEVREEHGADEHNYGESDGRERLQALPAARVVLALPYDELPLAIAAVYPADTHR